jgi:choline dehydrogenase-like flavoprotein
MHAFEDEADYVVVGTGAGGATAARVLTEAGRSVVLLEEGPRLDPLKRSPLFIDAMTETFRDAGAVAALGPAPFPLLQGRLVGGSTAINSAIVWRLPEKIRKQWELTRGLNELLEPKGLERAFEQIEKELGIAETPAELLGGNSLKLQAGARALGLPGQNTRRNTPGCKGRGMCQTGCPTAQRQGMDVSYVPRALKDGARLHALARAHKIVIRNGRAEGVEGQSLDPLTRRPVGTFSVRAKKGVISAGGAVQTPVLLYRSGLRGRVGEDFQAHPGCGVLARFNEPVGLGFGATQGFQVPLFDRGLKIESLTLPPEMLVSRIPGAGAEWQERLANLDYITHWAVVPKMKARGRVRPGLFDPARVVYAPLKEDLELVREGVVLACRMLFAAGANEVYPGMTSRPAVLTDASQVKLIEEGPVRHGDFHLVGTHLFGGACAGSDPNDSVVGDDLQCRDVKGLYAMDASALPTNTGVNPQHTIMGLVWRAAERLA